MATDLRVPTRLYTFFSQLPARLSFRLVLVILLVLIPALFLAGVSATEQNQNSIDSARQQALILTQLTAANHRQLVTGTEQILTALAQIPQVQQGDTDACNALFSQLRVQYESYTNFFMVDMAGDTICTGLPNMPPVNVYDRGWFQRALSAPGFSVSDYDLGAVTRLPIITLSLPIYDANEQKRYFLGASLSLDWLNTLILSTDYPPDTSLTVIDRVGKILYRYPSLDTNPESPLIGQTHPNQSLIQAVATEKTGVTMGRGIDNVDRLYAFVPLDDNASAFVIAGLSQDVLFAPSRSALLQSLLGLAVAGLLTLMLALYGAERLLIRPIRVLAQTTVSLAAGDLKTRVDPVAMGNVHELSELGRAFNAMSVSLERAHEELETKVRERTQDLALLAEASSKLASSLDYETTLKAVTELIVPELADWCTIDLLDETGVLRRLATVHVDPEKRAMAQRLHEQYPPNPAAAGGLYVVMRSPDPILIPRLTDEMLRESADNEEHFDLLRGVGMVSSIAIPLIARERVLGVMTLVSSRPERIYGPEDLKLAKELGRRAAVTIDNAYLYHEANRQRNQLQVTLSSIGDAVIATNIDGKIIFINPVAQEVTGWPEAEAIGKPLDEVFRVISESSGEAVENPFNKVVREGKIVGLANHTLLIARDGTRIPIDDSGAPIFDETHALVGVILVFRDISARRHNEQRLNLLLQLTAAFSQALTSHQIAEVIVEQGLKALGGLVGTVSLLVDDGTMLEIINRHGLSTESFEKYRRTPLSFSGPLNDAVRTDTLIWIETLDEYVERYPHFAEAIQRNGSCSTICIPLKINGKMLGGFNLSFATEKRRTPSEEAFFMALGQQCAQSLERARLYEAEQQARASAEDAKSHLAFLAEASAILATSLDAQQTLSQMTHLIVPDMADWTHVDLLREDQTIERLAVRHTNAEREQDLYELNRLYPIDLNAPSGPGYVIRTGMAEIVSIVDAQFPERYSQDNNHLEIVRRLDVRSYIVAPLTASGKTLGAITFASSTPGYYTGADLTLLDEFARRAALSFTNARLYQAEQTARANADRNLQRVNRLQAATAALSKALTMSQVGTVIVDHTTRAMNASSGLLARLVDNATVLDVVETKGYDPDALRSWMHVPLQTAAPAIAQSIKTHEAVWMESAETLIEHLPLEDNGFPARQLWGIVPLMGRDQILGVLILSIPTRQVIDNEEKTFLLTLAQQGAQAFERSHLYEQAKEVAALQERQRLARDLHDAVSQVLFSSTSIAEVVPRMWERNPQRATEHLAQVVTLNRAAMAEMRSLLLELRPETILRTNLSHLLEQLFRAVKGRKHMNTDLVIEGQEYFLPPEIHVAFYRIAQEAINNSVKHSQATHIAAQLTMAPEATTLIIHDNGQGFDTSVSSSGMGLHTMRERAVGVGLHFELESRIGDGVQVKIIWTPPSP